MSQGTQTIEVDVKERLADELSRVETRLAHTLDTLGSPSGLDAAYRHALLSGGKRIRPILAILSSEAVSGQREPGVVPGAAVEMVHAFSLVHDDLPALDDDDLRRGKPTVHVAHGEAMAILAGDGLLTHAYSLLCELDDVALAGTLCGELAHATGKMIDGQVLDTLGGAPERASDEERLLEIHRNKTGALIAAACRMGAIAGMWNALDTEKLDAITRYGHAMGLMFQAVDDLLDVESTPDELGKATQKDAEAGKLTYPVVFGLDETRRRIGALRDEALASCEVFGPQGELLAMFCRTMSARVS